MYETLSPCPRFILRVQRAKHPRTKQKCMSAHKAGARFYFASAKLLNILDIPLQNSQNLHFFLVFRAKLPKDDFFRKFFLIFLQDTEKCCTFALANREQEFFLLCYQKLGYGVMVTLQILVLPFLVRVRVSQQKR